MRHYEMMIILDGELDERTVQPSLEKFLTVVTKDGGTVDNVDTWGRRRMAYDIKKKSEGIYVVVDFTSTPATTRQRSPLPSVTVNGSPERTRGLSGSRYPMRGMLPADWASATVSGWVPLTGMNWIQ